MHQTNETSEIQPEGIQTEFNSMDGGEEDDGLPIDQAYLHHIEEQDIEFGKGIKRVRFKGV